MITANTDIQYLKGVGEKRAVVLKSKGIDTVGALLRFYPRAYLDWTEITPIANATFFENHCIKAKIITPIETDEKRGLTLYKFLAEDKSGRMQVTLFNQRFLAQKLRCDREYLFYGKLGGNYYIRQMSSPIIMEAGYNGIEPIYPASKNLSSKTIERLVKNALSAISLPETLSFEIRQRNNLCDIASAIKNIHFPRTKEGLDEAKKRLVFEELFVLQAGLSFLNGIHAVRRLI